MLVDDHLVVRSGVKVLLETQQDFLVVGEAESGSEALGKVVECEPDVVIMDISMPGVDGLQATRLVKEARPEVSVLALTIHEDKQYFFAMLSAGASGYLTKQAAADELISAVRSVAAGNVYLQPSLARWLLEDYRRLSFQTHDADECLETGSGDGHFGLDVLSERELQVLELVARGLPSPQIGKELGISPKTVSRHRERIMHKLNMHSSTELVKFAIRTGLVDV
jgi:two-component system response regulator NreC